MLVTFTLTIGNFQFMMGSKRKSAKLLNDTLDDGGEDMIERVEASISSYSGISDRNKIQKTSEESPIKQMLRHGFALGLSTSTIHHFPDLALGNDKYVSASFHMTPGKSSFHFRVGKVLEDNPTMVKLSEEGLNKLINVAPRFLDFIDQWDQLKKASDEDPAFDIAQKALPDTPLPVLIDDEMQFPVEIAAFKYKDTLGGGIALRSLKIRSDLTSDEFGRRGSSKPFGMTGLNFRNLLNIHIPFFRSAYEEIEKMVEGLKRKEGVTSLDVTKVTSWKNG